MVLTTGDIVIRLIVAAVLTGLIGVEREFHRKPAGIRTNALIGLGSAAMTLCGIYVASLSPGTSDPSRVASIVVQGVGFIGAGAIIQSSGEVRGLTTAASMWAGAGVGIATGFGMYTIALTTAIIVFILLAIFGPLEARLMKEEIRISDENRLRRARIDTRKRKP